MRGEILDHTHVGDPGRKGPLATGSHLIDASEVALSDARSRRLKRRVVSLNMPDRTDEAARGESVSQAFGSAGFERQRLLDQGVDTCIGQLQTDLLVKCCGNCHNAIVDPGTDERLEGREGRHVGRVDLQARVGDAYEVDTFERIQQAQVMSAHDSEPDEPRAQVGHFRNLPQQRR